VCHQTVCLIARHFENLGLPTLILGSALDILEAGQPPRAKFLNYPLGFESGKFEDKINQLEVVREALSGFETIEKPSILKMEFEWPEGWELIKKREEGILDLRSPRNEIPQYQSEADRLAAENEDA
jgi:hypothetical protein